MQTITAIGLDIAKSVFQVHGVDVTGQVVIRRQLKRRYVLTFFQKLSPCLVGIEACASSHHWSRELQALGLRACGLCFATEGGSGPGAVDDRHRERRSPSSSPKQSCAITGPSPPRQPICGRRSVQSPAVPDKLLLRTLPAEGLAL